MDVEVIKRQSRVKTQTQARDEFRDIIIQRDRQCVFSQLEEDSGEASHIIPFSRGDEVY